MTARAVTAGKIVLACADLRAAGAAGFSSRRALAQIVASLAGVSTRAVERAFADAPEMFGLAHLIDQEVTDKKEAVTSVDAPVSTRNGRRVDPVSTGNGPEPDAPHITPGADVESPQVTTTIHPQPPAPPIPPSATALTSALPATPLSPPASGPTRKGGYYSRIGKPNEFEDWCFVCGNHVPEGTGHLLTPYPKRGSPRVICSADPDSECVKFHGITSGLTPPTDPEPPFPPPTDPEGPNHVTPND